MEAVESSEKEVSECDVVQDIARGFLRQHTPVAVLVEGALKLETECFNWFVNHLVAKMLIELVADADCSGNGWLACGRDGD